MDEHEARNTPVSGSGSGSERYAETGTDIDAKERIVEKALAAGGRAALRLRGLVRDDYDIRATAYWPLVRKNSSKMKETSVDAMLAAANSRLLAQRETLLRLATLCDHLNPDPTEQAAVDSVTTAFKNRELKVITGTRRRRKLSIRLSKDELEILRLTNEVRKKNGLDKLKLDTRLVATARDHSLDMQTHNFFAHESPVEGKRTPVDRAIRFETTANAENLAAGDLNPPEVIQGWLESPGHRSNLLHPEMHRIGVGRVGNYWTALYGL